MIVTTEQMLQLKPEVKEVFRETEVIMKRNKTKRKLFTRPKRKIISSFIVPDSNLYYLKYY